MKVLAGEQAIELRHLDPDVRRVLDQTTHGGNRVEIAQREILLSRPHVLVDALEDRDEQVLLAPEVVVDHVLVGARYPRDLVHASAVDSLVRKFLQCRLQDAIAGVCAFLASARFQGSVPPR